MKDSKRVLVVAPHPDDEILGCGGSLLRLQNSGADIYWLIVTHMNEALGYSADQVQKRNQEIQSVAKGVGVTRVFNLEFPPARLDTLPLSDLVGAFVQVVETVEPDTLLIPNRGDVHSDHKIVFDACSPLSKSFRFPYIKNIKVYETLSETDFSINPDAKPFQPDFYFDITDFLDEKTKLMSLYESEVAPSPFPRNGDALEALARLRGQVAGCRYAEAFMTLKNVQ
jgi:LmbE family N-acetylglucosaminyl deacetylase